MIPVDAGLKHPLMSWKLSLRFHANNNLDLNGNIQKFALGGWWPLSGRVDLTSTFDRKRQITKQNENCKVINVQPPKIDKPV